MRSVIFACVCACCFLFLTVKVQGQSIWMPDSSLANYHAEKAGILRQPSSARAHRKSDTRNVLGNFREQNVHPGSDQNAEVFATINPADSSNIIISPILTSSGELMCPIYYSHDFGRTWSQSNFQTIPYESGAFIEGGGDPMFTWGADGKLYVAWIDNYITSQSSSVIDNKIYWATSSDGGQTFVRSGNGYIAAGTESNTSTQLYDKEWLAADRAVSPYRGSIYAAIVSVNRTGATIQVRRKPPGAVNFLPGAVNISTPNFSMVQFPNVGVDADGSVHCTFFGSQDGSNYAIFHAASTDGGATFSTPQVAVPVHFPGFSAGDSYQVPGVEQGRQYPSPSLAIDTSQGNNRNNLYLTWCANGATTGETTFLNIYCARSTDFGTTWSTPVVVNSDRATEVADHFNPSIGVNRNGTIAISWYDRRDAGNPLLTNCVVAVSFDGGKTFSNNAIASGLPSDHTSFSGSFGVGDYAATLLTDNNIIPVWCDDRMFTGVVNVFGAWVPLGSADNITFAVAMLSPSADASLDAIFPNPATQAVTINYTLKARTSVQLRIYDIDGKLVDDLSRGMQDAGAHSATLETARLSAGTYTIELRSAGAFSRRPLSVIK